ncbi:hypothetical protein TWF102_006972 [Orbilia oligospora]|uniref:Uncharacterized protein n=1 Tax=Orbilia oligospora TaxID=2813651 RepID=A0A7C8NJF8_ORBOL|nr:hypothetical protein TWF103_005845 [Orbilia oligospora]KAF3111299.1 hypothetical protein TWF102_006972 [Orbilia oligospora]
MAEYLRRVNRDRGINHEPTAPYPPGSSTNIQSGSGEYAASSSSETSLNGPKVSDDVESLYLTSDPLIADFARGALGLQNQKRRLLRKVVYHLMAERRCMQGELERLEQENSQAQKTVTHTLLEAEKYRSKTVKLKEIIQNMKQEQNKECQNILEKSIHIQNIKRDHDKELETLRNEVVTIKNKLVLAYAAIFFMLLVLILIEESYKKKSAFKSD